MNKVRHAIVWGWGSVETKYNEVNTTPTENLKIDVYLLLKNNNLETVYKNNLPFFNVLEYTKNLLDYQS